MVKRNDIDRRVAQADACKDVLASPRLCRLRLKTALLKKQKKKQFLQFH